MTKYSAIFMKDGGDVLRFRLSPRWLRAAIAAAVLLVLSGMLGAYAGYAFLQSWHEVRALNAENRSLQAKLVETQIQLERLQNVERILEASSPETLQAVLSSPSAPPSAPLAETAPAEDIDLADMFRDIDLGRVRVSDVRMEPEQGGLKLTFDLSNEGTAIISGMVSAALLDRRGRFAEVAPPTSDMDFSIQRFKRVQTSFELPPGREMQDFFALRLVVRDRDGVEQFVRTYPLQRVFP